MKTHPERCKGDLSFMLMSGRPRRQRYDRICANLPTGPTTDVLINAKILGATAVDLRTATVLTLQ